MAEDARRGPAAQVRRRQQMWRWWGATGKFRLPTDPAGPADQPTAPCSLAFGAGMPPEGGLNAW